MKHGDKVIVLKGARPDLDEYNLKLEGKTGTILATRSEPSNVPHNYALVKLKGKSGPVSFHFNELELNDAITS